ncbi:PAS domain-containing sensor histidine kinase [Rufibacter immobilis]|uniref:histidine kinase n=1 Tax=Rufibacter immobilis TaxID=1348778 RepID=A0A3M9MX66_9BACT|nr:PAS domain-containing sensor histidine kinase [Rufibacter immobilis]RNI29463.1 PAS domain-containing sensor histidine kinase [Rufibacter immobilis]
MTEKLNLPLQKVENEIPWEKLAQVSLDMFCTLNRSGVYTYVSAASQSILGYTSSEIVGRHFTELLPPEEITRTLEVNRRVYYGIKQQSFQNCLIHKNGYSVPILWSSVWSEEDGAYFCVARDITEMERNKQKLSESEQKYKTLFHNNPDIVFIENRAGLITEVNNSFCEVWGHRIDQVLNRPTTSLFPPELASVMEDSLHYVLQGHVLKNDIEFVVGDELRVYDTIKYPIYVNGEVVAVQTIAKDITPIVRSFQTIHQQTNKLNTIFESITDAFITLDRNWKLTYINREAERLVGLNPESDIGRSLWEIYPEAVDGEYYTQYKQAFDTGIPAHFTAPFTGVNTWLNVKVFPSAEGLSIYFEDITEQVRSRQELEKLSLVASKANNSILIVDKGWHIEWVNEGFVRLFGYSAEEVIGWRPSEFLHSPKTDRSAYENLWGKLQNGEQITFEILNVKKNGEEVWLSIDISPVLNEQGEISRFIGVHTDITKLKNSELELSKLASDLYKQNSDLQEFTYIISHNLRGPVANLLGLAHLLMNIKPEAESFQKSLTFLQQSVSKLDTVLLDLNTLLGIRESKGYLELEQVEVLSVFEQALASFKEPLLQLGGKVVVHLTEGDTVKANKAYLHSIFYNLLSNALKYRAEDRPLQVTVTCQDLEENTSLISFTDNGMGFDLEKAKGSVFKLYKRFHVEQEGRGMGLFLIKSHLDAMAGTVEVTSQVNAGTQFLIRLPKV